MRSRIIAIIIESLKAAGYHLSVHSTQECTVSLLREVNSTELVPKPWYLGAILGTQIQTGELKHVSNSLQKESHVYSEPFPKKQWHTRKHRNSKAIKCQHLQSGRWTNADYHHPFKCCTNQASCADAHLQSQHLGSGSRKTKSSITFLTREWAETQHGHKNELMLAWAMRPCFKNYKAEKPSLVTLGSRGKRITSSRPVG